MDGNGESSPGTKPRVIANHLVIALAYEFGYDDEYAATGYYIVTDSNGDTVKSGDFSTNGYGRFDFHGWRIPEGSERPAGGSGERGEPAGPGAGGPGGGDG